MNSVLVAPDPPLLSAAPESLATRLRGGTRVWMSPLNVHVAVAALLLLAVLYMGSQIVLAEFSGSQRGAEAVSDARAQQVAAELAARPLRGLDQKVAASEQGAREFYEKRLPFGYADIATELGTLRQRTGVRLSRVQYVQAAPVNGLTEIRMDAAVSGEYRPLALFLNALERDRSFFLIQRITLSGSQNGQVNLRLGLVTYLREPMPSLAGAQQASGDRP